MEKPTHDSLYLLEEPANQQMVERLYEKSLINQQGKEYALDFLYPRHWAYWIIRLSKIIGIWLIFAGLILLFAERWQHMSIRYHTICVFMGILVCVYGTFVYAHNIRLSQLLLAISIVLTTFSLFMLEHFYHTKTTIIAFMALLVILMMVFFYRAITKTSPKPKGVKK